MIVRSRMMQRSVQRLSSVQLDQVQSNSISLALDGDALNEETRASSVWQQHIRQQQRRNWMFEDDEDDDGQAHGPPDISAAAAPVASSSSLGFLCHTGAGADMQPDTMIGAVLSLYSPSLYAYGLFETVDIVENMLLCGLIDGRSTAVGSAVESWFVSPGVAWRHRGLLPKLMGQDRYDAMAAILEWMLRNYDSSVSPLQRASRTLCQNDLWCTFLRGMAAYGLLSPELAPFLPVVIEAAIKGNLKEHALQGDLRDRAHAVATLLQEASVEYGSPTLLDLAMNVFSQFAIPTDYHMMLRVQQSFNKTDRRHKDWALRSSGSLSHAIPGWIRSEFPKSLRHLTRNACTDSGVAPPDKNGCAGSATGENAQSGTDEGALETLAVGGWSETEIDELYQLTKDELAAASNRVASEPAKNTPNTPQTAPKPPEIPRGPLFTDTMEPLLYFGSSTGRLGRGRQVLDDEVHRHRGRQSDLAARGLDACLPNSESATPSPSLDSLPLGCGELFLRRVPTFQSDRRELLEHVFKLARRQVPNSNATAKDD